MNTVPSTVSGTRELTAQEQGRAIKANELMQRIFEQIGVSVSNWTDFAAWQAYVQGEMHEAELKEKAKIEMEDLAKKFGKYVAIREEEPLSVRKNPAERERARVANKIYRKICKDMQVSLCFFSNFSAWSDFVKGLIGEAEFYKRAHEEAERMVGEARAA